MSARRTVSKSGKENGRLKIPEGLKAVPDKYGEGLVRKLNSRYKSDRAIGAMEIENDIYALGHFAKTSDQKEVRLNMVSKLTAFMEEGKDETKELVGQVLEHVACTTEYEDTAKSILKYLFSGKYDGEAHKIIKGIKENAGNESIRKEARFYDDEMTFGQ